MSAIKAGDRVMVWRSKRCGCAGYVGYIFVVQDIDIGLRNDDCIECGAHIYDDGAELAVWPDGAVSETWRLIKLPPLTDPESITRDEEVTA